MWNSLLEICKSLAIMNHVLYCFQVTGLPWCAGPAGDRIWQLQHGHGGSESMSSASALCSWRGDHCEWHTKTVNQRLWERENRLRFFRHIPLWLYQGVSCGKVHLLLQKTWVLSNSSHLGIRGDNAVYHDTHLHQILIFEFSTWLAQMHIWVPEAYFCSLLLYLNTNCFDEWVLPLLMMRPRFSVVTGINVYKKKNAQNVHVLYCSHNFARLLFG